MRSAVLIVPQCLEDTMTIIDDNTRSSSKQAGSLSTPYAGKPLWMKMVENTSQNGLVSMEPAFRGFCPRFILGCRRIIS
jgi:hypothetical protein